MASCSDIPGRIWPSEGLGRLSTAKLMTSGVMFIQLGIPSRNCAMGPDWAVRNFPASSKSISRSSLLSIDSGLGTLAPASKLKIIYWHRYCIRYRVQYWGRSKSCSLCTRYCFDIEGNPSISGTIFNFDALCTPDMYTISNFWFDIEYNTVLQYWDIRISKVKTLMSYMISVQCRETRRLKVSLWYQMRYWVWYTILWAAGCTSHIPALLMGPASWSSTRLDGLYSWVTVLTPFPAGVQLLSVAAVAGLVWTAGWSRWTVLISSYLNTSDLVMIRMMSVRVEYAFSLSLVFCLDAASDTSVFLGPAEPAGPAATDWHCWATVTAAWGLQTNNLASRSHEVTPSNRQ